MVRHSNLLTHVYLKFSSNNIDYVMDDMDLGIENWKNI